MPQKQPPASTIVCNPPPAGGAASRIGAGMTTADSACARVAATAKTPKNAKNPKNAVKSSPRINGRREKPRPPDRCERLQTCCQPSSFSCFLQVFFRFFFRAAPMRPRKQNFSGQSAPAAPITIIATAPRCAVTTSCPGRGLAADRLTPLPATRQRQARLRIIKSR